MPPPRGSGNRSTACASRQASWRRAPAATPGRPQRSRVSRRTYAALHLQHGTDVYYVSRQLGHADIALTVGTYGAWLRPNRRAAVDALDRIPTESPADAKA